MRMRATREGDDLLTLLHSRSHVVFTLNDCMGGERDGTTPTFHLHRSVCLHNGLVAVAAAILHVVQKARKLLTPNQCHRCMHLWTICVFSRASLTTF